MQVLELPGDTTKLLVNICIAKKEAMTKKIAHLHQFYLSWVYRQTRPSSLTPTTLLFHWFSPISTLLCYSLTSLGYSTAQRMLLSYHSMQFFSMQAEDLHCGGKK
jgi:hypothetical protein